MTRGRNGGQRQIRHSQRGCALGAAWGGGGGLGGAAGRRLHLGALAFAALLGLATGGLLLATDLLGSGLGLTALFARTRAGLLATLDIDLALVVASSASRGSSSATPTTFGGLVVGLALSLTHGVEEWRLGLGLFLNRALESLLLWKGASGCLGLVCLGGLEVGLLTGLLVSLHVDLLGVRGEALSSQEMTR